ncbi:MAG: Rpn family recombination-promoting nuclease/putative transposase [Anaerolineales bacterium]|nr:Rpn family recombination-promoting nuclease/putative transposase [Anaerolineales bacterium]
MSKLTNPHDKFFKETFTRLETARDFFANYLPASVTAVLDLNTLRLQSGSFVDGELQEQFADLLYQVALHNGDAAYLYLLLEHKSYPDPATPFQLLRYLVRIWERDSQKKRTLRPIIPVVVYHGREQWQIATNFAAQFSGPEALRPYWPTFLYELHDLSRLDEAEIHGQAWLQIALLVLKYIFDPALNGRLADILALFHDLDKAETALEYLGTVLYYVGRASTHLAPDEMVQIVRLALADKGSGAMKTVADYWIEQGIERGIEQGIEQGRIENLQDNILDLIEIRLGQVDRQLMRKITAVSDLPTLRQLHREAATAPDLAAFTSRFVQLTEGD